MCRGSSTRRQCLRYLKGVSRKFSGTRWIGEEAVRASNAAILRSQRVHYLKASKGAEKSCLPRRRKRGLRRGKVRSRGCHPPPITATPAPKSKGASDRLVSHHIRMMEHWTRREAEFRNRLCFQADGSKVDWNNRLSKFSPSNLVLSRYAVWKSRWSALSGRVPKFQRRVIFSSSFYNYLRERVKVMPPDHPPANEWSDLLAELRIVTLPQEPKERLLPHRYTVTCDFCKNAWSSPTRNSRCTSCRRLCVGGRTYRRIVRGHM
jgi:hypothetical protein